jgi:hypothetical protein
MYTKATFLPFVTIPFGDLYQLHAVYYSFETMPTNPAPATNLRHLATAFEIAVLQIPSLTPRIQLIISNPTEKSNDNN